ncbi:rod shape-determining protein MreC [Streptococcus macacae]|uniref:Cell shape-determining protein MreC n=1 Tax=Streptococcus macacae NCTC 11558 TaxID=764298 RepID=G5JXL4_9STRE|nr:rod shape-determining protein MreC [Streptococcus macacae]EHJ51857.1 rod shape-determining protein MreC [Streptococcus macacae NCTC 11558]SUN77573.1 putative cell shape-determining protein [Streptococcus macacae NCTC 11558]
MKRVRFSRFIVFVTTLVIAISIGIFFILNDKLVIKSVSNPVNLVVSSVDKAVHLPVQLVENVNNLFKSESENKTLKKQLTNYQVKNRDFKKLKEENSALRDTLKVKESFSGNTVLTSKVIVRSPISWFDILTVNIGKSSGVKRNMLALSNGNLIGKVNQITLASTSIKLLSNTKSTDEVPVKITSGQKEVFGILTNYDKKSGNYEITQLTSSLKIKKGDKVSTSGLDGKSPEGLTVGKVDSEENNSNTLSRKVFVKPAVDLSNISYVTLVGE